jgi:lipopolysaccharide transport system permease protein
LILPKPVKSVARRVNRLLASIPLPASIRTKLDLLKTLIQRDLEARYKGSILGNFWPLVNQLSQLLIYTYVFSIVLKVKLDLKDLAANDFTFGLWLFAGLVPWIAFNSGLSQAATAVIAQPNLVKKVIFPLELLPLVPIGSAFLESTLGQMVLICLVGLLTGKLSLLVLLLPLIWIPQLLLTAGLGYLAAGLTVFLRDIPQTLSVVLNLWFYLTPIVYPLKIVPDPFRTLVFWLNPLAAIAQVYRDLILVGHIEHAQEWGVATAVAVVLFAAGFWVYQRLRPGFADVL